MAVFVGKNGVGKTTFFDVFGFLHDALNSNIRAALQKRGGFGEVISRGQSGRIEFKLQFRPAADEPLVTYELAIGVKDRVPFIAKEVMRLRRGQKGAPWKILDFSNGKGFAVEGDLNTYADVRLATREPQSLDSPDILAIKGLGQFKGFRAVASLRRLMEDWHVSDFHVDEARSVRDTGYSERLSRTGDNLALVAKYLFDSHRPVFDGILERLAKRVPGIDEVSAEETSDGRIVLRFKDKNFIDPFSSRFVSDGTIKMFTYLILLSDPEQHALLCVEEPENQLYPHLLHELVEEFRAYAMHGGQVFISTHSPDFVNAVELPELFCLVKENGYTRIERAAGLPQVEALFREGDKLGELWRHGLISALGDYA
jgi:predicted ATPase